MELSKSITDNISYTVGNDSIISDSQYMNILSEIFNSASGKEISKGFKSLISLSFLCLL